MLESLRDVCCIVVTTGDIPVCLSLPQKASVHPLALRSNPHRADNLRSEVNVHWHRAEDLRSEVKRTMEESDTLLACGEDKI